MASLLNSNMMLRWANSLDPDRLQALTAMQKLRMQGEVLHSTPQNYIEFWAVATRPIAANGLGLGQTQASHLVQRLQPLFPLLPDTGAIFNEWLKIVLTTGVSGKQVHDARLVAVMLVHGITNILTFNVAHFLRFQTYGITVTHPSAV